MSVLLVASSFAPRWIAFAQQQPRAQFEVASIKPNKSPDRIVNIRPPAGDRFRATGPNLKMLIRLAYNVRLFEILGGPSWADSEAFDIDAKAKGAIGNQLRPMLQSLLEDRFKLRAHRETKQVPVYFLVPAKGGLKLPEVSEGGCVIASPDAPPPPAARGERPSVLCGVFLRTPNFIQGGKVTMARLANTLTPALGRAVIDKTGFTGMFDVHLEFSAEGTTSRNALSTDTAANAESARPSLFTALQEQLGLKPEDGKAAREILVIDHVEKPDAN